MSSGTDAAGGGHAHTGLMIYQGRQLAEEVITTLCSLQTFTGVVSTTTRSIDMATATLVATPVDFMKTDDPWFRGVEMVYGPDGCGFPAGLVGYR